jgi:Tol biopolymer transport system component
MVYLSTQRNGADRDIWLMDPAKPESNRLLLELQGGGWGVSDWSNDDTQLLVIERLSINSSHLWLVDIAKKSKTKVVEFRGEVAIADAKFSADGKSLYVTSDVHGEFLELSTLDLESKTIRSVTQAIPWNIEFFEMSPDRSAMVFSANEAGVSKLYVMGLCERKVSSNR